MSSGRATVVTSLIFALAALAGSALPASAAAPSSTNAIRVSPALSNIQLSAKETSATVIATITNLTPEPLSVAVTARDFGASIANTSAISFYGKNYNPAINPHGLQTAISLDTLQVILAPHDTRKVAITLNGVDKLAAGGHYGAVLFSPAPQAATGPHVRVAIGSAIASLIFLKTASGGTQTLQLISFSVSPLRLSLPGSTYIAFKDTGNTQSAPQGQLTLYGPNGSIVSTTVVNPGSGLILPGTSRLFTVPLPLPHAWLARPGMYRLELQYRDSTQTTFTVVNKQFFYINLAVILPLLLLAVLAFYGLKKGSRKLLRFVKRLAGHKAPESAPPEKPKRRPPLIQG